MNGSKLPVQADSWAVKRRNWLMTVVGGAASFAGAHIAWRSYQTPGAPARSNLTIWQRQFQNLDGSQFPLASLRGRPLVLNFWATWCPPCVEELPLLSRFYQENAASGWQVLGLAIDQLAPVKKFLARSPVSFPVVIAGAGGIELARSLGSPADSLPFTVVLGSGGEVVQRKIGRMQDGDLRGLAPMK